MSAAAKATLLVVDDEAALREAIAFDFKRKGFNVITAENGKEAFEIVKGGKVDLVLSDVRMPEGSGVELLSWIKEYNHKLPVVIFITGFTDMPLQEAYARGADAVFSKPFDRKALLDAVERSLAPRETAWASPPAEAGSGLSIQLQFPEMKVAMESRVLNIGRGGVFVGLKESFPVVGAAVFFQITFSQDKILKSVEGTGVVRWVRTQGTALGLPPGCGIEFTYLDEQCRARVLEFIDYVKAKSYIPEG